MTPDSVLYLCNFDDKAIDTSIDIVQKLWINEWAIEDLELCKKFLATGLNVHEVGIEIKKLNTENPSINEKICQLAISAFLTFCEQNWNAHPAKFDLARFLGSPWPEDINVSETLQKDSEPVHGNILYPELLYLSHNLFAGLVASEENVLHLWWLFRAKMVHQRVLEETSDSLYSELQSVINSLSKHIDTLKDQPRLQILLYAEFAQMYLYYGRVQETEKYLTKARDIAGLKLELTGVMGKRTKFQQTALAQLALTSTLDQVDRPSAEDSHGAALPPQIQLEDDVRLDKIQYHEEITQAELPSLEQLLCLLTVQHLQKSQARDELMDEEIRPYIDAILSQHNGPWSTRVAALLLRCKIEANHKRTVERAMLQCEAIVNDKSQTSAQTRLSYVWASGLPPAWTWHQQLADLYLSLGLVKAALEEYLKLQLWEDVIVCYTLLQLRHKAAEIIQQQIDIKPTVKLYCLLGDATDDVKCYEKAWEFSKYKSSRAQRHWGHYLYEHKQYEQCIPHYQEAVRINSLQEGVWLRLGYAALVTSQWEVAATAYRRYTTLQPNSFEAWNNLAKVYLQSGEKDRAYRALMEALKYNYDNWKLWENVVVVSMETRHYDDVIRGCHRLLDLVRKYDDVTVLKLLAAAVVQDLPDADGNKASRLQKRVLELFGRITSMHPNAPELWRLYADVSPTHLLRAQRLLKAYRGYTQNDTNWSTNPDTCKQVIELAQSLLESSLKARQECEEKDISQANSQLSSARLTGQAVVRAAERQHWPQTEDALDALNRLFSDVTEYMKSVL